MLRALGSENFGFISLDSKKSWLPLYILRRLRASHGWDGWGGQRMASPEFGPTVMTSTAVRVQPRMRVRGRRLLRAVVASLWGRMRSGVTGIEMARTSGRAADGHLGGGGGASENLVGSRALTLGGRLDAAAVKAAMEEARQPDPAVAAYLENKLRRVQSDRSAL